MAGSVLRASDNHVYLLLTTVRYILLSSYFAGEKTEAQIGEDNCSKYTVSKSFQDQTFRKKLNQVWNLNLSGSTGLFLLLYFVEETRKGEPLELLSRN